jgi:hypothetical protein
MTLSTEGAERWGDRMLRTCALLLVILAIAACSTPYQSNGFTGGYKDTQIDANTFSVTFEGNGYTSASQVDKYLLYRCAELTAQAGADYFVILQTADQSRSATVVTQGPTQYFSTGPSTVMAVPGPALASNIRFPTSTAMIKVFTGPKPELPNAFVAKEVLHYLGKSISK